jgi:ABC-type dipeptide/oligopeptide/nickel transport system ATPase subunit
MDPFLVFCAGRMQYERPTANPRGSTEKYNKPASLVAAVWRRLGANQPSSCDLTGRTLTVRVPGPVRGVRRWQGRERLSVAQRNLEAVGLAAKAHHLPLELSGREQQRVAIARAVACEPKRLVGGEPTGNPGSQLGGLLSGVDDTHGAEPCLA